APVAVGADRVAENPRVAHVVPTHAPSMRPARRAAHCHAATAQPTRAYQSDPRSPLPDPHRDLRCHTPLTIPSISGLLALDLAGLSSWRRAAPAPAAPAPGRARSRAA